MRKLPASTDGRGGVEHRLVEVELDVDRASNKPLVHGFPLCGGFVDRRVGEGNNDWKPSAPPNPGYQRAELSGPLPRSNVVYSAGQEGKMPDVLVEVRGGWSRGCSTDLLDAVHAALVETLCTPAHDKVLRLIDHPSESFIIPAGAGERYTRIEIAMFTGRSREAKRALYRAIIERLKPFDVPPEDVKIVLVEVPPESVGLRGGKAACDVDLGYVIGV